MGNTHMLRPRAVSTKLKSQYGEERKDNECSCNAPLQELAA